MSELKPKKAAQKKYVALKNLCAKEGVQVKKGETFACSSEQADKFRSVKAIQ